MPKPRSPCPIACTLDLIGDRWTMLIVRDLLLGRTQFKEFLKAPEGIATNILASRLNRLTESGIVERFSPTEQSAREAYRLTAKGESLRPVVKAIANWGLENIEGTAALLKPKRK